MYTYHENEKDTNWLIDWLIHQLINQSIQQVTNTAKIAVIM